MLIHMTLAAALLVAVILVVRRIGRGRIPGKAVMVLWDIAALRLLMPWSIPGLQGLGSVAANVAVVTTDAGGMDSTGTSTPDLLHYIWIAGALICAVWCAVLYLRDARRHASSLPLSPDEDARCRSLADVKDRIGIRVSEAASSAAVLGIVQPRIILPPQYTTWTDEMLRCVLTHEAVHAKRADNLRRLIMLAAACLHWFNPLAWLMAHAARHDAEAACDEESIRTLGEANRMHYARTLVTLAEEQSAMYTCAAAFGSSMVKGRLKTVLSGPKRSAATAAAAVLLMIGAVSVFGVGTPAIDGYIEAVPTADTEIQSFTVNESTGLVTDELGRVVATVDSDSDVSYQVFDSDGRRVSVAVHRTGSADARTAYTVSETVTAE